MKKILLILAVLYSSMLFGQSNAHYWSYQYGARGLMLNGAVVGSVDDETAIYYNPGAMALNGKGVSLSFITPSASFYNTKNLIGENRSIRKTRLGFAPGLVSGIFKLKGDKLVGGFTSFTRYRSNIKVSKRLTGDIQGSPDKMFLGEVYFKRGLFERWIGFGLSYKLAKNLSIGATQFTTFHLENLTYRFKREVLDRANPTELAEAWRYRFNYGFSNYGGMLTKFGLSWQPDNFTFGLTYTSHTYGSLYLNGNYGYLDQKIYTNRTNTTESDDVGITPESYQRTPWSLAAGISIGEKKHRLHLSAEYFSKVDAYNIIDHAHDPYNGNSYNDEPVRTTVRIGMKSVVNFAIGIEQYINRKYKIYYGARTDFNASKVFSTKDLDYLGNAPNMYHVSFGTIYDYKKSRFSFGADVGYGFKRKGPQLLDIANITRDNIFEKPSKNVTDVHAHIVTIFITYSL